MTLSVMKVVELRGGEHDGRRVVVPDCPECTWWKTLGRDVGTICTYQRTRHYIYTTDGWAEVYQLVNMERIRPSVYPDHVEP